MNDNVAQLQKDLDLRDKRERDMKDGLIRLEERLVALANEKCE